MYKCLFQFDNISRDNDERFELLQECNDSMLERINSNLDDLSGIRKVPETVLVETEIHSEQLTDKQVSGSWNENKNAKTPTIISKAR